MGRTAVGVINGDNAMVGKCHGGMPWEDAMGNSTMGV